MRQFLAEPPAACHEFCHAERALSAAAAAAAAATAAAHPPRTAPPRRWRSGSGSGGGSGGGSCRAGICGRGLVTSNVRIFHWRDIVVIVATAAAAAIFVVVVVVVVVDIDCNAAAAAAAAVAIAVAAGASLLVSSQPALHVGKQHRDVVEARLREHVIRHGVGRLVLPHSPLMPGAIDGLVARRALGRRAGVHLPRQEQQLGHSPGRWQPRVARRQVRLQRRKVGEGLAVLVVGFEATHLAPPVALLADELCRQHHHLGDALARAEAEQLALKPLGYALALKGTVHREQD